MSSQTFTGVCPICANPVPVNYRRTELPDGSVRFALDGIFPVHGDCRSDFEELKKIRAGHVAVGYAHRVS